MFSFLVGMGLKPAVALQRSHEAHCWSVFWSRQTCIDGRCLQVYLAVLPQQQDEEDCLDCSSISADVSMKKSTSCDDHNAYCRYKCMMMTAAMATGTVNCCCKVKVSN